MMISVNAASKELMPLIGHTNVDNFLHDPRYLQSKSQWHVGPLLKKVLETSSSVKGVGLEHLDEDMLRGAYHDKAIGKNPEHQSLIHGELSRRLSGAVPVKKPPSSEYEPETYYSAVNTIRNLRGKGKHDEIHQRVKKLRNPRQQKAWQDALISEGDGIHEGSDVQNEVTKG